MTEDKGNYMTASNWLNSDEQEKNAVENSIAIFRKMLEKYERRLVELNERIAASNPDPSKRNSMEKERINTCAESIRDYAEQILLLVERIN